MALSRLKQLPIADLQPEISTIDTAVHGVVTLVWPYSSVNRTFSFLLVEPDFRLRRHRGQVRVSLKGSCARHVARAGLTSGDELRIALHGVQWQKDKTAASTPGRGIDWELLYADNMLLERIVDGQTQLINTNRTSNSPELRSPIVSPTSVTSSAVVSEHIDVTPKGKSYSLGTENTWSSPIFIKDGRLPDIFPSRNDPDPFLDDAEWAAGLPAKRAKFGTSSGNWRYVESFLISESAEIARAKTIETIETSKIGEKSEARKAFADTRVQEPARNSAAVKTAGSADAAAQDVSIVASQEANYTNDRNETNGLLPKSEQSSQSMGQNQFPVIVTDRSGLSIPRLRSRSRTPEPGLQIVIQEPTPLTQPVTSDLRPLTPRLQPLPSPDLAIVSPIYQRQHPRSSYFVEEAKEGDTRGSIIGSESAANYNIIDPRSSNASDQVSANTSFSHPSTLAGSSHESIPRQDAFFDKLLANYDLGPVRDTKDVTNAEKSQDASSLATSRVHEQSSTSQMEDLSQEDAISSSETTKDMMDGSKSIPTVFRTAYDYYSSLATLQEFYNNITSLLASVVASSRPVRTTTGPRDYNQTLYLSSPQLEETSEFVIAQIFRPYSDPLPHPISSGAVVLLKDFKVQSYQKKMSLVSTETSAWVVFDNAAATNQSEMNATMAGPKVEYGSEERGVAWDLGKWWIGLDKGRKAKLASSATNARDKAQADLEKKASAAAASKPKGKTKGKPTAQTQTQPQTQSQSQSQSQSQPLRAPKKQNKPSSKPATPTSPSFTPSSPTHRRTRSSQTESAASPGPQASSSSPVAEERPPPTHRRTRSTRSTRSQTSQAQAEAQLHAEHELRSGLTYEDDEEELAEIPGRSLVE